MRTIFIATVALLLFTCRAGAFSSGQIMGQVVQKEGKQPVAYAEVILENSMDKIVLKANEHGYYYGNSVPTGKYQVRTVYNKHVFTINKVKVYDNYTTEVSFQVSSNDSLPPVVMVVHAEPQISEVTPVPTNIRLAESTNAQPTRTLGELLSMQPGLEIINGKAYIHGGSVKFFIDGAPVMGPVMLKEQ